MIFLPESQNSIVSPISTQSCRENSSSIESSSAASSLCHLRIEYVSVLVVMLNSRVYSLLGLLTQRCSSRVRPLTREIRDLITLYTSAPLSTGVSCGRSESRILMAYILAVSRVSTISRSRNASEKRRKKTKKLVIEMSDNVIGIVGINGRTSALTQSNSEKCLSRNLILSA